MTVIQQSWPAAAERPGAGNPVDVDRPDLSAGVAWPVIQMPTDFFVRQKDVPWVDFGAPGVFAKMFYASKENNIAYFLFAMAPHSNFPLHEHTCLVLAYTLWGEWEYSGVELRQGHAGIEDVGSVHFPTTGDVGFCALTILIGQPGNPVMLRSQDPETLEVGEVGIDFLHSLLSAPPVEGVDELLPGLAEVLTGSPNVPR